MSKHIFFLFFALFLSSFTSATDYMTPLTYAIADLRYCKIDGSNGCTFGNTTNYNNITNNYITYNGSINVSLYYNASISNDTYRFKLTNNCTLGQAMVGEYYNGTPICSTFSSSGNINGTDINILQVNASSLCIGSSCINAWSQVNSTSLNSISNNTLFVDYQCDGTCTTLFLGGLT